MLGLDLDRGWKGWATRIGLVALLAVGACSLEVNIHLDSDDEEAVPVEATDVELPPTIEIPAPSEDGAARIETPDPIVATAEEDEVEVPTDPELPLDPDDFPVSEPTEVEMRRRSPEEVLAEAPTFTPYTRAPQILNRMEVIQAMEAEYPEQLKAAGIGGTVKIYYFIDAEGRVRDTRLDVSSGQRDLDAAAMRVASVYRFSPALNRDEPVPVWVSFPITFAVR